MQRQKIIAPSGRGMSVECGGFVHGAERPKNFVVAGETVCAMSVCVPRVVNVFRVGVRYRGPGDAERLGLVGWERNQRHFFCGFKRKRTKKKKQKTKLALLHPPCDDSTT